MIRRDELMLYDWVYNKETQKAEPVSEIGEDEVVLYSQLLYSYDAIEPITIDVPLLEKIGFVWDGMYARYTEGTMEVEYYKHEGIIREWYLHKDGSRELIAKSRPGYRHLHSLQNWLRVNGISIHIFIS